MNFITKPNHILHLIISTSTNAKLSMHVDVETPWSGLAFAPLSSCIAIIGE